MDALLAAALEEVCAEGPGGISIRSLWLRLQSHLSAAGLDPCNAVKQSIWSNLLNVPGMRFQGQGSAYGPRDPLIRTVEASEQLELKIVAPEHLRDSFLGLTDQILDKEVHRRMLERIAVARTNGITQRQLSKEFGMKGNNIFYPLKYLECRQLIARRSTILRTKGPANEKGLLGNDTKSALATNLIHLCRYAKHLSLNPQQRLEITKCDKIETFGNAEGSSLSDIQFSGECSEENMLVKDFVPAMKAICDKLEEASGKVLVVSDIKQALGYRKTPGHRAWRNICNRLKDARLVEEFRAEINNKVVNCLRLLKKFDMTNFQQKPVVCANGDFDTDQLVNYGKMNQTTEQLVELPIAHQIFDMVEAAGSKGITLMEVSKRLGLKINYTRFNNMFSRFGICMQAENHNKSTIYRIWTSGNFELKESPKIDESKELAICGTDASTSKLGYEISGASHDVDIDMLNEAPKSDNAVVETSMLISPGSPIKAKRRASQRYPCLPTTISVQREQRILQKLQDEKFILTAELHKWLEGFEKGKPIPMARKTLARLLNKLQQEGQCRCVPVSVPVVTNCRRSRITEVVLHPSVEGFPPDILCQIHEKLRLFDMQTRGHGLSKLKKDETVPVLTGIERSSTSVASDTLVKAEAMRANGFVAAKMIRAKLLHNFLWGYLCSLPTWPDALSSGKNGYDPKNPQSTCQLFALNVALKAMPLELFLQVAGSVQKFEDLIDGCRHGLCLSDLPFQEYKSLLNDNANERLSRIIDILIRLKLIRLVGSEHDSTMDAASCAILTHAMELKPYIEEPLFGTLRSSRLNSSDLRPRIRHDFILSNQEAVDAYWNTLEYCYAAADPVAASHAFPGSAVNEVFHCRSWAALRVMSADQRAELLRRISNLSEKRIPFKDCVKIARELNLSLEQVLRLSYDRRRSRLPLFQGEREFHQLPKSQGSNTRKRKRSSKDKSLNHAKNDTENEELSSKLPQCDNPANRTEQEICSPMPLEGENIQSQACDMDGSSNALEEFDANEGESSFVSQFTFSMLRPTRKRKFSWTEKSDRRLVVQYARCRAALGPRYNRVDWASISDLPAPPDVCRRRMSKLNSDPNIRRAVMKVCSLLGERYAKHLDKMNREKHASLDDSVQTIQNSPLESPTEPNIDEDNSGINFKEYHWDDLDEENIKRAIDEVIRYKRMAKPETSGRVGSSRSEKEWSDLPEIEGTNLGIVAHDASCSTTEPDPDQGQEKNTRTLFFVGRSRSKSLQNKFQMFLNKENIIKGVRRSLSIASAVELLKVAFLSTSAAPEVPKLIEGTLRRYSERDIIAAFNYLREKKFMIIGHGSQPFIFSQRFWHHASASPFPVNTGKRADSFAKWLHKRESELLESETNLGADLQCGDMLHLFGLVSSGELFISPHLPDEGIGEADDQTTLKRKPEKRKSANDEKAKKLKSHYSNDIELYYRREKGFPGIKVLVTRATFSKSDAMEWFTNDNKHTTVSSDDKNSEDNAVYKLEGIGTDCSNLYTPCNVGGKPSECLWEAISRYALMSMSSPTGLEPASSFPPKLFQTVHVAICNAGEQGLSMEEISEVIVMEGDVAAFIVDILQMFRLVVMVNAYECVRALDASYGPKYFLNNPGCLHSAQPSSSLKLMDNECFSTHAKKSQEDSNHILKETSMNLCDGHKVTILDVLDENGQPHCEVHSTAMVDKLESYTREDVHFSEGSEKETHRISDDLPAFRPILPWLNGDGSTNSIIYRGLTRRILGMVMQNPGILEDDIIHRMDVLNPQSCRKLLELLVLDNHISVREMHQTTFCSPPALLGAVLGSKPASVFRKHYFASPICASLL